MIVLCLMTGFSGMEKTREAGLKVCVYNANESYYKLSEQLSHLGTAQ